MSGAGANGAAQLRARLSHPIVDADGHWLEFGPLISPELRRIGGDRAVEGLRSSSASTSACCSRRWAC